MNDWRQEYRKDVDDATRETRWTLGKVLVRIVIPVLVVAVALTWLLDSAGIISMNIEREVVQSSRQYVESKQGKLHAFYADYLDLQRRAAEARVAGADEVAKIAEAQQKALIDQMRDEVTNIPSSEVPDGVRKLLNLAGQ